jgi:outer membrane receptor protein involved in Fe transport
MDRQLHARHGAHTFKTGGFFNRNDNGQQPAVDDSINHQFRPEPENPNDRTTSSRILLLGNYTSVTHDQRHFLRDFRFYGLEFYGQDSWKVNRKLTLEFGARYVYLALPTHWASSCSRT